MFSKGSNCLILTFLISLFALGFCLGASTLAMAMEPDDALPMDVIRTDVTAQNNHDWSTFLAIRTTKAGPPENRNDWIKVNPEADIMKNIVTAQLAGIKNLPFSLAESLTRMDKYLELYSEVKAYYVAIDYRLKEENRSFYNGVNYRFYVLASEEGHWVIIEASEAAVHRMIEIGYGFGTPEEELALKIQEERELTGKFINPEGEIIESLAMPIQVTGADDHQRPSIIKVYRVQLGQIDTVDFYTYVKNVLPNEWIASWPAQSLLAGAIACKMYGWYRVYFAKYPGQGYDVRDDTWDQVYKPGSEHPNTNKAVDDVNGMGVDRADGKLFETQYCAGTYGPEKPSGDMLGRMSQWGTKYWADQGEDYIFMVHYYWDYSPQAGGQLAHFFNYWEEPKFDVGDTVEVYNTGASGLFVRGPGPCDSPPIGGKFDGDVGVVLEGPEFCDGYNRWRIQWIDDGLEGWSAEDWLREIAPPDLIVDDIWVDPAEFGPGDTVEIYTRIKNIGDGDAVSDKGLWIYGYFDGDKCYEEGIEGLGAGADTGDLLHWTYTWPSDTKSHPVKVEVDPDDYITESNETNNDLSRSFSAIAGSLTVTINPSEVRDEARWRLTSGPDTSWKRSGETISSIPTGGYTLQFHEVSGWNKPSDKTVTISEGSNSESGTYVRKTGSLTVTINPSEVRDEARWRLTSGPDTSWKRSGETISSIPTGDYTLEFHEVSGWSKPSDKTVTISEGDNFETGTYEQGPSITLTAPNGGECIKGGSSLNVTWKTSGSGIDHIRLLYSTDSGNTYPNTIIASTQDDGTYEWTTPLIDSSTVRVKAIAEDASNNALAEDESDGDFIIDSTPPETTITLFGTQGDNSWYISDVTVELNATDNLCGVKKTEYKINELEWQPYSSEFTISSEGTTTVYYRSEDNAGNIEPEKTEAIKIDKTPPSVTLTSPIGGENWAVGTTHDITWTAEDTTSGVASIKIEYSTDSGSTWKPIADGEENDGTYSWTIPDDKSEYCRVKVTAYDNASNEASDASDSDFTITDEGEPISGTITDGVNPIPATVEAWQNGTLVKSTDTPDGSYVLHLPAGAYAIRAYSDVYYAAVLPHEITPPAADVNLSLEKAPNVTITNKVCDFWSQDLTSFDWQTKHIPLEVQIGDVITARYPDGIICGIATVGEFGTDEGDYFIHVYGDDATTPDVDEGAQEGDTITFFINGYPASVISGTPQWHSGGSFEVCLSATISKTVDINLCAGWNFLSFNVEPPNKDIETVLASIDGLYTYVRGMECGGKALTYDPSRPFNDLEQLEPLHGYEIKMSSDAILPVTGMPVGVTTPIALCAGWNFISYLPDVPCPTEEALASIDGLYTYVRGMECGGKALTYDPSRPFNDLEQLEPLHGYEIKMSSDATLVYPSSVSLLAMQTTTDDFVLRQKATDDFVLPRASVPENQKPSNNQVLISNLAPALGSEAISGTVTDGIDAIQNATVQAWQNNQKIQETTTASDGSYTLSGLAEGTYIVRAHKEGFYATYLDNQPAPSNGVNVVLESLPSVISTNLVCDFWSMDSATYSGDKPLLQIGDVVTAIDPDGVICGVTTVGESGTDEGDFFLHVYGDDPTTPDIDEGATEGDTITLMLNKYYPIKDVNPQPVWHVSDSIQLTLVQFDRALPVSLTAATATRVGDQIILRWITESETNNLGWDVYRSDARDGKYRKINAAMIAGAGTSAEPHTYRFIDENVEAGKVYFYYLENIDFDGKRHKSHLIQVETKTTTLGQIKHSALYQNFPNPFNPDTWIPFKLASDSPVVIDIYDIKGKLVRRLDLGRKKSGYYLDRRSAAHWDGRSQTGELVASGIYLYTIKAGKFTATRRMVVVK